MFRVFELYGIEWIEKVNKETLKEVSQFLHRELNNPDCNYFRVDEDEIPLTFVKKREDSVQLFDETIEGKRNYILSMKRK